MSIVRAWMCVCSPVIINMYISLFIALNSIPKMQIWNTNDENTVKVKVWKCIPKFWNGLLIKWRHRHTIINKGLISILMSLQIPLLVNKCAYFVAQLISKYICIFLYQRRKKKSTLVVILLFVYKWNSRCLWPLIILHNLAWQLLCNGRCKLNIYLSTLLTWNYHVK